MTEIDRINAVFRFILKNASSQDELIQDLINFVHSDGFNGDENYLREILKTGNIVQFCRAAHLDGWL